MGRMCSSKLPAELERTWNRRGRTHLSPDELVPLAEMEQKWNRKHFQAEVQEVVRTPSRNGTEVEQNTSTPSRNHSEVEQKRNRTLLPAADLEQKWSRSGTEHIYPETKWYPRQKWNRTHLPGWLDGKIIDLAQTSRIYCC